MRKGHKSLISDILFLIGLYGLRVKVRQGDANFQRKRDSQVYFFSITVI